MTIKEFKDGASIFPPILEITVKVDDDRVTKVAFAESRTVIDKGGEQRDVIVLHLDWVAETLRLDGTGEDDNAS